MAKADDDPVDAAVIARLKALADEDDPHFFEDMVRLFLETAGLEVEQLKTAAAVGNAERMRAVAHGLKGSSANLGATRLSKIAAEIENHGKANTPLAAAPRVEDLVREFALVAARLRAEGEGA